MDANSDCENSSSDKIGSIDCKRDIRLVSLDSLDNNLIDSNKISFLKCLFSTDLNNTVALNNICTYILTLKKDVSSNALKFLKNSDNKALSSFRRLSK